jgi:hypothetical protein
MGRLKRRNKQTTKIRSGRIRKSREKERKIHFALSGGRIIRAARVRKLDY